MNATSTRAPLGRANRTRLAMMLAGMIAGALGAAVGIRAAEGGLISLDGLGWSGHLALWLAMLLFVSGVFCVAASFSSRLTARSLDPESTGVARPAQMTFYRIQGAVLVLAGLMMGAPVAARQLVDPLPPELAMAVMAALVAASIGQTALNLSLWNRADEMMRRMISEVGAICFWVLQALFFLWAAAEVLGLAPALSSWDLMTVLMAVYLCISAAAAYARGYN